jgi:diaminobutyrate-2-oxoglutarate transaminase
MRNLTPVPTLFDEYESNVRLYCRDFPAVFARAKGAELFDVDGRRYIDFLVGAGALNYGHNPDPIKQALLAYLGRDGITHALDTYTTAKGAFLERFADVILKPRGLDYKVQFCGPTGANGVEAALKLARKITGRTGVFSFTGAYHGLTLGSLAATGNRRARAAAGVPLAGVTFVPYADGPHGPFDSAGFIERLLADSSSGVETPAAILVETVQMEGGVWVAPVEWLRELRAICDRYGILLVCDDIQAGIGRAGRFFSFERAEIIPDIVVLSKSIGGYGIPMTILLMRRSLDAWSPGEHTGTFRANQLALVAATAALEYWSDPSFAETLALGSAWLRSFLQDEIVDQLDGVRLRGIGMAWGIDLAAWPAQAAERVMARCFERGLVIERCGRNGDVMKLLPPLTIEPDVLEEGCAILVDALRATMPSVAVAWP